MKTAICDLLIFIAASLPAAASSISGSVTDPDGAPFPGAFVSVQNAKTGAAKNLVSTEGGRYDAADLPGRTYDVTITVPGMKTFTRTGLVVEPTQNLHLDARLEDGQHARGRPDPNGEGDEPQLALAQATADPRHPAGGTRSQEIGDLGHRSFVANTILKARSLRLA